MVGFSNDHELAQTTLFHSLQIGTLVELLGGKLTEIRSAFSAVGLEIPPDEEEIRAQKEKERAEGITKIRTNLGNPDTFTGHMEYFNVKHGHGRTEVLEFPKEIGVRCDITVSEKLADALANADISDVTDVIEKKAPSLIKTKGVGKKGLEELLGALYDAGVRVKEPEEAEPATPSAPLPEGFAGANLDNFSDPARRTLVMAWEEAHRLNHIYIDTEHILLGLLRVGEDAAAVKVLVRLGFEPSKIKSAVEYFITRGYHRTELTELALMPRAIKVLKLAVDEARKSDNPYVGTEHLLLGLVREGEGIAAGVLESLGVNLEKVGSAVREFYLTRHSEYSGLPSAT